MFYGCFVFIVNIAILQCINDWSSDSVNSLETKCYNLLFYETKHKSTKILW